MRKGTRSSWVKIINFFMDHNLGQLFAFACNFRPSQLFFFSFFFFFFFFFFWVLDSLQIWSGIIQKIIINDDQIYNNNDNNKNYNYCHNSIISVGVMNNLTFLIEWLMSLLLKNPSFEI
jgi:hypothetical protein